MTTVDQWCEQVKEYVLGGAREEFDLLGAAIVSASATSITITDGVNGIQAGAELEVGLERMYVRTVVGTAVTVLRGYRGTTATTHLINSVVTVNSKAPKSAIVRELNNELASLSSPANGLFKTSTIDLTWAGSTYGYNLTDVTDIEDVLSVQWQGYTGSDWVQVPATQWRLGRSQNTTDFASGLALFFDGPVSGRSVRVVYKAPFTSVSVLTDVVETVTGLPATAVDIPVLGAAAALKGWGESRRTLPEFQGDSRADEDVPPGSGMRSGAWFLQQRRLRIAEESARLQRDYPVSLSR